MKTLLTLLTLLMAGLLIAPAAAQLDVTVEDMYYDARAQLREGDYMAAADGFGEVAENHRDHDLAPKALYWRAFALSRDGERRNLIEAKNTLELLYDRYRAEARRGDSAELAIEIRGQLAALGDADAAREIAELAEAIRGRDASPRDREFEEQERATVEDDRMREETRLAALNALLQMSPDRATPILRKILVEKPDEYSPEFRARAVFLISQNGSGDETLDTLMHVIRNDEDQEVRAQGVFWLSQAGDPRAVDILEGIALDTGEDIEIRDKAIFALSQIGGDRAAQILRDIAVNEDNDLELRAQSVFWIGQSGGSNAFDFLVDLYRNVDDVEIKDKAIFSISQTGSREAAAFFADIVRDPSESTELRKQAFFWMGQMEGRSLDVDVVLQLFEEVDDEEVRQQAIFVLSQMGGGRGVDALIEIAKSDADPELREKAIFWLGQTDDERAADYLMELIEEDF